MLKKLFVQRFFVFVSFIRLQFLCRAKSQSASGRNLSTCNKFFTNFGKYVRVSFETISNRFFAEQAAVETKEKKIKKTKSVTLLM